jgi:hypothetical protein
MNDEPIDLTALDPMLDGERFESALGLIRRDAVAALAARATRTAHEGSGFGAGVTALWLPALLAAALVVAVSTTILLRSRDAGSPAPVGAPSPNVLGIPPRLAELMRAPDAVSLSALDDALGDGR